MLPSINFYLYCLYIYYFLIMYTQQVFTQYILMNFSLVSIDFNVGKLLLLPIYNKSVHIVEYYDNE